MTFDVFLSQIQNKTTTEAMDLLLSEVFRWNKCGQVEAIPLFVGVIAKGDHFVNDIRTLTGKTSLQNPFNGLPMRAILRSRRPEYSVGTKGVFVATKGRCKLPHELIVCEHFISFKDLGIAGDEADSDILKAICDYDEFSDIVHLYSDNIQKTISRLYSDEIQKATSLQEIRNAIYEIKSGMDIIAPYTLQEAKRVIADIKKKMKVLGVQNATELESINAEYEHSMQKRGEIAAWLPLISSFSSATAFDYSAENELPTPKTNVLAEIKRRLKYNYNDHLIVSFLTALSTTQIITMFGKPGTGKTTFVDAMARALGAECSIINVQNNWTDSADLLGYYSPIDKTYESTPFLDALIRARCDYFEAINVNKSPRLHIICLDEMNLARVEYYFATFLGLLQMPQEKRVVRLLPTHILRELKNLNVDEFLPPEKEYLKSLKAYEDFLLPPNVKFVGTINNDDTTNFLSPKVIDRSFFIEMKKGQYAAQNDVGEIHGYYPLSFFDAAIISADEEQMLAVFKDNENNRFLEYARDMFRMFEKNFQNPDSANEIGRFCEMLIVGKVLPSIHQKKEFVYEKYEHALEAFKAHDIGYGDTYNYLGG